MKIINADTQIYGEINGEAILRKLESIGRTCYKSENESVNNTAGAFVASLIKKGHESILEHETLTIKFIVDRGISHEIVRHRLASFAQESTRYCNYSKNKFNSEITVIKPFYLEVGTEGYKNWKNSCETAEKEYFNLLNYGCTPEEARAVLPNSLKTELIMTADLREWRHFFNLRALNKTGKAHPQMLEVTRPLLKTLKEIIPIIFDDLE